MDIMIDLETLGSQRLDCVFPLVGWAAFDPFTCDGAAASGVIAIDANEQIERGLSVDWKTIQWWLRQEEAARMQLQRENDESSFKALPELLRTTFAFHGYEPEKSRVWAWPADFDLAILRHGLAVLGEDTPWHRRDTRDAKTLAQTIGREEIKACIEPRTRELVEHRPDHDCIKQVHYVQEAIAQLGITNI